MPDKDSAIAHSNKVNKHENVDDVPIDDAHKTEKVTKLGRDNMDPDEGGD